MQGNLCKAAAGRNPRSGVAHSRFHDNRLCRQRDSAVHAAPRVAQPSDVADVFAAAVDG